MAEYNQDEAHGMRLIGAAHQFLKDYDGLDAASVLSDQLQEVGRQGFTPGQGHYLEGILAAASSMDTIHLKAIELQPYLPEEFFYLLCVPKDRFSQMGSMDKLTWKIQVDDLLDTSRHTWAFERAKGSVIIRSRADIQPPQVLLSEKGNLIVDQHGKWVIQVFDLHELRQKLT